MYDYGVQPHPPTYKLLKGGEELVYDYGVQPHPPTYKLPILCCCGHVDGSSRGCVCHNYAYCNLPVDASVELLCIGSWLMEVVPVAT